MWLSALLNHGVLVFLFLSFVLWQFLCDLIGNRPFTSCVGTVRWIFNVLISFFLGSVFLLDQVNRRTFLRVFLGCTLLSCIIACLELALGHTFWSMLHLEAIAADPNLVHSLTSTKFRTGLMRPASLFAHPIVFGQFLAASLPLTWAIISPVRNASLRLFGYMLLPLIVGNIAFNIYATSSRSALLVLAGSSATAIVLVASFRKSRLRYSFTHMGLYFCVASLSLYLLAGQFLGPLVSGRNNEELTSTLGRQAMLERCFAQIRYSPVFGYGADMSGTLAGLSTPDNLVTLDSLYLAVFLDFGYVGVGIFVLLIGAVLFAGFRAAERVQNPHLARIIGCMLAFIVSIMIGQSVLGIGDNLFYVFLMAAYFVTSRRSLTREAGCTIGDCDQTACK